MRLEEKFTLLSLKEKQWKVFNIHISRFYNKKIYNNKFHRFNFRSWPTAIQYRKYTTFIYYKLVYTNGFLKLPRHTKETAVNGAMEWPGQGQHFRPTWCRPMSDGHSINKTWKIWLILLALLQKGKQAVLTEMRISKHRGQETSECHSMLN